MIRSFFLLLFFCTSAGLALSQITAPGEFLPHEPGEHFTPHHMLVDYFQLVAQQSDRVVVDSYGATYEDRPLIMALVSSPDNLRRYEEIRLNNLRRIGLEPGEVDPDLDVAIVWLGYSIHGNEAAGSEASLKVLYDLVTSPEAAEWLENVIVIIDPCQNPDGKSRYTDWYRHTAPRWPNPNYGTIEHDEPWPYGRVNHYLFDLNRDWAWQTQLESQQRMRVYRRWMPQVYADLHEMGPSSPYFFAPAAAPFHQYITPFQREFQYVIGRNNARYFDESGWLYFTREVFDLFYPSYGDTYTTFNGAIGMTYEQGGSGRAGRAVETPTDDELTLYDRLSHHAAASMATVEAAAKNSEQLLDNFASFFQDARRNPPGAYRTYMISANNPADRLENLTTLLDRNGIEWGYASDGYRANGFSYRSQEDETVNGQAGDLIISAHQPRAILTQILFDPEAELEDSLTYDITAWALPYAYDLEAYATTSRLAVSTDTPATLDADKVDLNPNVAESYAVVVPWKGLPSARFLAAALREGLFARRATKASVIEGQEFGAGAIVFTQADNRRVEDYYTTLAKLLAEQNVEYYPLSTGFSSRGADLGSGSYELITKPRIATLGGPRIYNNEFGQVWHFFERDLEYPIDIYRTDDVGELDLDDIDILILPEGRYRFNEATEQMLSSWVRAGGKLIAIGAANNALAASETFALSVKEQAEGAPDLPQLAPYGDQDRAFITGFVPGAIVDLKMDDTHPLAIGLGDRYFSLKTSGSAFAYLEDGWNVGRLEEGRPVAGFMGAVAQQRLAETLSYGVEELGRGQVVYLVDNPLFRSFWYSGKLLFSNALFQF
ncbi:MAG: M14 family metallopeptidase [Bacteroidota bacterium]